MMSQSGRDAGEASTSDAHLHVENANRSVWLLKARAFLEAFIGGVLSELSEPDISLHIYCSGSKLCCKKVESRM